MVYDVNVAPISPKLGIQILDFLSKLGYYKTEGNDDFECTTTMIDLIAENVKSEISILTNFEKVDLGIALMIIPIQPALELANECFENISETDFNAACHDLAASTDYFEKYKNNKIEFIDGSNFAIGIIVRYLRQITGKMSTSEEEFRMKFQEITKQISDDIGSGNLTWTKIKLTTCGAKGQFGPSRENCISTYKSDWSKDKKLFDVDPDRKGIQKIRITKSGSYEIKVWGAGNYKKTGSGNGFRINSYVYIFII